MACLKCGKKTKDEQCFCPRCLEIMEDYPVRPDVHVHLPNRPAVQDGRKASKRRRALSADEQLLLLRRRVRILGTVVLVLTVLLGVAMFLLLQKHPVEEMPEIGKNYSFGPLLE